MATKKLPDSTQQSKPLPNSDAVEKELPNAEQPVKEKPSPSSANKQLPKVGVPENTVNINGKLVEIKPTKLKYTRNRTALFYKALDLYPVVEIMSYDAGVFDPDRDGDKCIMDFLIAVTDDEQLILDNYDSIDVETIEKILAIYKRLNKIDEKEQKRKNLQAATMESISKKQ